MSKTISVVITPPPFAPAVTKHKEMKKLILLTTLIIWTSSLLAQIPKSNDIDSLTNLLIGVWEIDKIIDKEGIEVNTIIREMKGSPLGDEIQIKATGPKITLNKNTSYELEFTPKNIDKGNWLLQNPDTLIFQLITLKGTSSYDMLKMASEMFGKTINYNIDGNIVENNPNIIVKLTKNELIIKYETDYFQVYKKKE